MYMYLNIMDVKNENNISHHIHKVHVHDHLIMYASHVKVHLLMFVLLTYLGVFLPETRSCNLNTLPVHTLDIQNIINIKILLRHLLAKSNSKYVYICLNNGIKINKLLFIMVFFLITFANDDLYVPHIWSNTAVKVLKIMCSFLCDKA